MNIVISILTVKAWGLIGVAIGTLCAMLYQTVWMAIYDSKQILNISLSSFFKHVAVDVITAAAAGVLTFRIPLRSLSYASWIMLAIIDALIWAAVIVIMNMIFYRSEMKRVISKGLNLIRR